MPLPVVGHSVSPFLFGTGSWIHGQLVGLTRWRAVVVTKRRENEDVFPFEPVYSRSDLPPLGRLVQRAARRFGRGYFPYHRRVLEREGALLLHSHFGSQGWRDLPLARALGIPLVVSVYGADVWKLSRQEEWVRRYRELFGEVRLVLCEGNAMRAKLIELGCPPERARVQHLGVDLASADFHERAPEPDGTIRLLAAGRAVEKKGFDLAVRAFALAHRRDRRLRLALMLIARAPEEKAIAARLARLVEDEDLALAVDFPPPMPYEAYRRSLAGYHVFLCPSRHASNGDAEGGAPVSLIEMSACGMPIVASRHCDIPEVVPDGESGLLFPENDVDAMAEAILALAARPETWPAMGRSARAHVEREYALATQVRRLEAIYDEVAALAPAGAP